MAWVFTQNLYAYTGTYTCHLPSSTPMHDELLAIWRAIASHPYTRQKPAHVFTDSHTTYSEIFCLALEYTTRFSNSTNLSKHGQADNPIEIIWMLGHTDLPEGDTAAHATASSAGGTTNLSLLPPFGANLYELLSNTVSSVATMPYVHRVLQSITSRIVYHFLSELHFCTVKRSSSLRSMQIQLIHHTPIAKWRQYDSDVHALLRRL